MWWDLTSTDEKGIFCQPVAKVTAEEKRGLALLFPAPLWWTDSQWREERQRGAVVGDGEAELEMRWC